MQAFAFLNVVAWMGFWAFGYIALTLGDLTNGQVTIAAVLAVDVVALVEVERPVADPTDGGGGLLGGLTADRAGGLFQGVHGGGSPSADPGGTGFSLSSA